MNEEIKQLIEEEAERQLSTINAGYWHSGESYTAYERGYEEGFITGASFICHQNRWRKVSEEDIPVNIPVILRLGDDYTLITISYKEISEYANKKWKNGEWKPIE